MFFGGLFSAYVLLRGGAASWPSGAEMFGWQGGLIGTLLLAAATTKGPRVPLLVHVTSGLLFVAIEAFGWSTALEAGVTARSSVFAGLFFVITGVHMLHVLAGVVASLVTRVDQRLLRYYWWLVDLVWVGIVIAFHL
jgi:cytochrome c oxidase subunit 3